MISVIICTHNPLPHFLTAILQALQAQSLPRDQWELILVDNLSAPPLSERFDLSWHPHGRIVVEEKMGLTYARWAGFQASRGELIVYVDDDNVLAADYLEETIRISEDHPFLGAWGGQILMEFDQPPTPEEQPFTLWQLHHEFNQVKWRNFIDNFADTPAGAGLAVRRPVLETYTFDLARDPLRQKLGRSGPQGGGCREDTDIVLTALQLGFGVGQFPSLVLRHLTPRSRLTRQYCLKQAYSIGYSTVILNRIWHIPESSSPEPLLRRIRQFIDRLKTSPLARATHRESLRGRRDALEFLREFDRAAAA